MDRKIFVQDEDARRRVMGGWKESDKPSKGENFYCRVELDEGSKYCKDVMADIRRQLELNLGQINSSKDTRNIFSGGDWRSNRISEGGETHYYSDLENMDAVVRGFRESVKSRNESAREGTDEILRDFLKDDARMSEVMAGVIIGRSTGAQPVFVTNWPSQTWQNITSGIDVLSGFLLLKREMSSILPRLAGGAISLRALLGLGAGASTVAATETAAGASTGSMFGPVLKPLIAFGGGYAIGTGINKGLGAALGIEDKPGTKWYEGGIGGRIGEIHHDIRSNGGYLDNAAYFYGRNVIEPVNKWMESVSPKVGEFMTKHMGFGIGETDEATYPNPIRDYAAPPEGMEENVSDIFKRERIVRIENAPPEIKNQNKVNLLINLYEDGRTYVETDLNTEPKIDFRRGYMD